MIPFSLALQTGLLNGALFKPSPHCDDRPVGMAIDMIVIHNISLPPGEFGGPAVAHFFCGNLNYASHPYFQSLKNVRVSAHLFINRRGEVMQFVPFSQRAWHAGQSSFDGKIGCNDFSIGIELEGTDTDPYEIGQYETLIAIIKLLRVAYPAITPARIVGHATIAPGRKTDPGLAFDWQYLKEHLEGIGS